MTRTTKTMLAAIATAALSIPTFIALAATGAIDLSLADNPNHGSALTDRDGNYLYLFINDAQGESKCYETCATNWPPLVTDGDVNAGARLDTELVGTSSRTDGTTQVTYGGWPLYRFIGDTTAGMTAGHGANDAWFLINAAGEPVPVALAQTPATTETVEPPAEEPAAEAAAEAGTVDPQFATYMEEGAVVFATICAACHGAQGNEELSTHVALLAGNSRLANARLVVRRVIHGGTYMPPFGTALSDREVAAVATFVRNSFGNEYGFVGEEEAASMR